VHNGSTRLTTGPDLFSHAGSGAGRSVAPRRARVAAALILIALFAVPGARLPAQTLDPASIEKYATPLVIPPAMPRTDVLKKGGKNTDYYEIAVRQFRQQILPAGMPATTVWSYGSVNHPGTFNYPAFTIEAKADFPVRVKWINDLVDENGDYLPHLLPVDQTLHWANPPGSLMHRDHATTNPEPYLGPVPIVTHVHGAHTTEDSDGYPEAWYLPAAKDIPPGYAETGTFYDVFKASSPLGSLWEPGSSVFEYPNDQRATTLWYHDHSLGMTRLNVYAGPAGFYLLRGGPSDIQGNRLPGPAPALGDPVGKRYYEIPIAIQDRSFREDGELWYPDNRAFFEGLNTPPNEPYLDIPFIPELACDGQMSDISPMWNPEFFGNTIVVNGNTWPNLDVEPRRYRFRFLNGSQSRFLILKVVTDAAERPAYPFASALPFWQIGSEGGFLPEPVKLEELLIGPAERADVIVDFTGLAPGSELHLVNLGPDEPFGGGVPGLDFPYADPETTGQVMRFVVGELSSRDNSLDPARLKLPKLRRLPEATVTRKVSLNELDSATVRVSMDSETGSVVLDCEKGEPFGPMAALLGTVEIDDDGVASGISKMWHEAVTENPALGATEVWEIYNFTADAHPIHIHQVMFEVVNREVVPMEGMGDGHGMAHSIVRSVPSAMMEGPRPPEAWETGHKDTVIAYPGEVTRVKARFDIPGLFVWHCHILEHEDNEMMRPYRVGP